MIMFDVPRKGKKVKAFWIEQNKSKGLRKGCLIFTFFDVLLNNMIYIYMNQNHFLPAKLSKGHDVTEERATKINC